MNLKVRFKFCFSRVCNLLSLDSSLQCERVESVGGTCVFADYERT